MVARLGNRTELDSLWENPYTLIRAAGVVGFEPANGGFGSRCAEPDCASPLKIVFQLSTSKSKPRTRRGLVVPK